MNIRNLISFLGNAKPADFTCTLDNRTATVKHVKLKPSVGGRLDVIVEIDQDGVPFLIDGSYRLKDGGGDKVTVNGNDTTGADVGFHAQLHGFPPSIKLSYRFVWTGPDTATVHTMWLVYEKSLI